MKRSEWILFFLLGTNCPLFSTAQTVWQTIGTGDFENPANWSAGIPTSSTDATIANGTSTTPTTANLNDSAASAMDLTVGAFDTLNINAGANLALSGTNVINSVNVIVVNSVLNNSGLITVNADAGRGGFLYLPTSTTTDTYLTLQGGGTVTLNSGDNSAMASIQPTFVVVGGLGSYLTNVDNTIQGYGSIGSSHTVLNNDSAGTIEANVSGQTLVLTLSDQLTNAGLLEATNGATLQLPSTVLNNKGGIVLADGGNVVLADVRGGTLTSKNGGQLLMPLGGELDGVPEGAITITSGSSFAVAPTNNIPVYASGALINSGNIQIGGGSRPGRDVLATVPENSTYTITLTGGGTVTLASTSNNPAFIQEDGANVLLMNVDNTIQGDGIVGYSGQALPNDGGPFSPFDPNGWPGLSVDNETNGKFDANIDGQILYLDGQGGVTNTGLLEATGGGILSITGQNVSNVGGTVVANGGKILITDKANAFGNILNTGPGTITGGTVAANGGLVLVDNGSIIGSVVGASGGGSFGVDAGYYANLDGATLSAGTTWSSAPGSQTNLLNSILNHGLLQINAGGGSSTLLKIESNLTLWGGGAVTLNSGDDNGRATIQSDGSYTLTNGDNLIQGYGTIGGSGMSFVNGADGIVDANIPSQSLILATVSNQGLLEATSRGRLQISNSIDNEGCVIIGNGSDLSVGEPETSVTGTYFQTSGRTVIARGGTLSAGAVKETGGTIQVDGSLDPANIDIISGELGGTGTLHGDVENGGHILLGDTIDAPGILSVVGTYQQVGDGVLFERISDADHGILDVSGNVTLDGWVDVDLLNGFTPTEGQLFEFLEFGGSEVGFLGIAGPEKADWTLVYEPGFINLEFKKASSVADRGMTWALLGIGLVGVGLYVRFSRQGLRQTVQC